ncbi:hypothetical protein [Stutzerimonas zhaodongensis]|uniref:hypothetical protein n=1 Tax=Stutzerimonas zhaodongensis TaxID=1176257 RepID=UPI001F4D668A|nr:hypothetical protein [Stutzerimonas zhaodongensis]UNG19265.1 hypothetical protein MKP10_03115 [Stutzerimonas zhaodongensis]
MLIDGQLIAVPEGQQRSAREQLDLPSDFNLVEATRVLQHDTGNGVVHIPLPPGLFVAAFENLYGQRRYGVVSMEMAQ